MKVFPVILSCYFIILSWFPCNDVTECGDWGTKFEITGDAHHEDHSHTSEACSPFCTCSCCESYVCIQQPAEFVFPLDANPSVEAPYQVAFYSYELAAIWQPPKLG